MRRIALLLLLAVSSCSSSSDAVSTAPDASIADGGTEAATPDTAAGDPNVLAGTFQLKLATEATSFIGKVYDGASLDSVIWDVTATEGDCRLLVPRTPFCDPACGSSAACVAENTCKDYPTARSVGVITLTGVKSADGTTTLTMSPVVNNYQPTAALAYPPFADGDAIQLSAAGADYAAFTIASKGIAPLALTGTAPALARGKAIALAWTAGSAGATGIAVKLDVSHHGGSKGKIECATADDGTLEIASTLVDPLLDLGVAGFPTIIVTRKVTGSATIAPGRVDLVISSEVEEAVTVDGLTSCNDTSQCPTGKTCQSDLTCK